MLGKLDWGLALNFVGLLVGLIGVGVGVSGNLKLKTAREAAAAAKKKLFNHMAAEQIGAIGRTVFEIALLIRTREWSPASKLAGDLTMSTGNALGAWRSLLNATERGDLEAAREYVNSLVQSLPVGDQQAQIQDIQIQQMLGLCRSIMDTTSQIAGRLRIEYLGETAETP